MITWSGAPAAVDVVEVVVVAPERIDANGFMSDFQIASPKQIAATMAMPAMAMTMSFLKVAPDDVDADCVG
jgi:thiamine biosynthesis lipoprotein ApbE